MHGSSRILGIGKSDIYSQYLAYHEGPGGYARGSYLAKGWLAGVAAKVQARADLYTRQYAGCRERLERGPWYWPF